MFEIEVTPPALAYCSECTNIHHGGGLGNVDAPQSAALSCKYIPLPDILSLKCAIQLSLCNFNHMIILPII